MYATTKNGAWSVEPHRHSAAPTSAGGRLRLKCIVLGSAGAGKTSILRRFFNNTFEYGRRSTMGADFYSRRISNPVYGASNVNRDAESGASLQHSVSSASSESGLNASASSNLESSRSEQRGRSRSNQKDVPIKWSQSLTNEPYISLQCWDTAGRERFVADNSSGLSSTLGSAFFSHADAAILVYDATSSRSFTQLIKWYSELIERMKNGADIDSKDSKGDRTRKSVRKFPVLVVANKLDILKRNVTKPIRRTIVPQRNVMKLNDGFKGKDHRYEYSVSSSPPRSEISEMTKSRNQRHGSLSLSYGLTDTTWTSDNSYLNSVIRSEDGSFPDRDMVILWCRRNGLKHIEVSALEGTGINECIDTMVKLTLESMNEEKEKEQADGSKHVEDFWKSRNYQALDLHERYAPKEKPKLCWRLFPCCR